MLLKAPIVQVLEAECSVCFFSKHYSSIVFYRYLLYFIAITKNLHNVIMFQLHEVIKFILELLIIKIWIDITKLLDSNFLSIFSQSLSKTCYQYSSKFDFFLTGNGLTGRKTKCNRDSHRQKWIDRQKNEVLALLHLVITR